MEKKKHVSENEEDKKFKTSFNTSRKLADKLKYVALMEKRDMSEYLNEAMEKIVADYEKRKGPIPVE